MNSNLLFPFAFALIGVAFGLWTILRPEEVLTKFVHSDDRNRITGRSAVLFVKLLGVFVILLGIGQLVDQLIH